MLQIAWYKNMGNIQYRLSGWVRTEITFGVFWLSFTGKKAEL